MVFCILFFFSALHFTHWNFHLLRVLSHAAAGWHWWRCLPLGCGGCYGTDIKVYPPGLMQISSVYLHSLRKGWPVPLLGGKLVFLKAGWCVLGTQLRSDRVWVQTAKPHSPTGSSRYMVLTHLHDFTPKEQWSHGRSIKVWLLSFPHLSSTPGPSGTRM